MIPNPKDIQSIITTLTEDKVTEIFFMADELSAATREMWEQYLHGSRATLAILVGVVGNTHGLCLPNSWALQTKPDGIACETWRYYLLRRLATDVTRLK